MVQGFGHALVRHVALDEPTEAALQTGRISMGMDLYIWRGLFSTMVLLDVVEIVNYYYDFKTSLTFTNRLQGLLILSV